MIGTRLAKEGDRSAIAGLVAGIPGLPAQARDAVLASVDGAFLDGASVYVVVAVEGDGPGESAIGFACASRVPLAHAAVDVHWIVARRGLRARDIVEALVTGVAKVASPSAVTVRFSGGTWQRGGLDPYLFDAVGMTRIGILEDFYGPDDPLVVFAVRAGGAREVDFEPGSPAALYDAAFGYRDIASECRFLLACAERFGALPVRRAASWGCGSARHLLTLGESGIGAVGVDENEELLGLATRLRAARDLAPATFVPGPLDRPAVADPVDLSFSMLSAVHRVGSEGGLVRHLQAAGALLAPGGVHVLEATLPVDATPQGNTQTTWTERRGSWLVQSRFRIAADDRAADGTVPTFLDVRCRSHDSQAVVGSIHQQERWIVPTIEDWRRIVEASGVFSLAAALGDFHLDVAWDQPGAWRMILVLRRT